MTSFCVALGPHLSYCAQFGASQLEGCQRTGKVPAKDNQDNQDPAGHDGQREVEGAGFV